MAHSPYKTPWLSSIPSPEVYPFDPRHASSSRFSGEETETSAWTLGLFFISASPKLRARLSFPSYTWKEAAGPALNAPLLAADAHSLSFSPWASAPVSFWDQRPGGYSGLSSATPNMLVSMENSKICQRRPFSGVFEGHILRGHLFPFTSLDNVAF